ncbi:MAG: hypothetical protein IT432_14940 [Phycisphaerales bacterium]|nr:hypothetical protein [Phycisphaerales bacterium]
MSRPNLSSSGWRAIGATRRLTSLFVGWALLSAAALSTFTVFWLCIRIAGFVWRTFLRSPW